MDFIMCMSVCDDKDWVVPGSTKEKCSECGNEVWLSPATKKSIEENLYPKKLVCDVCVQLGRPKDDRDA